MPQYKLIEYRGVNLVGLSASSHLYNLRQRPT